MHPDQPSNAKILKVAVIGAPNAGKSTLTNAILNRKVSSVSSKVHTTRTKIKGIHTDESTQLVFLDTPGLVHPSKVKRHNLDKSLLVDPHFTIREADRIAVVVDVSKSWSRASLDPLVLQLLHLNPSIPSVLVLNKVDLISKKSVLLWTTKILTEGIVGGTEDSYTVIKKSRVPNAKDIITKHSENFESSQEICAYDSTSNVDLTDTSSEKTIEDQITELSDSAKTVETWQEYYEIARKLEKFIRDKKGWSKFEQVFMVSSKERDGVEDLKDYLMSCAKSGDWLFHSSVVTDQDPWEITKHTVWEKLLDHLNEEVPYNAELDIVYWSDDDHHLQITVDIIFRKQRYVALCLGKRGARIKQIAEEATQSLMNTFQRELSLKLAVMYRTGRSKKRN